MSKFTLPRVNLFYDTVEIDTEEILDSFNRIVLAPASDWTEDYKDSIAIYHINTEWVAANAIEIDTVHISFVGDRDYGRIGFYIKETGEKYIYNWGLSYGEYNSGFYHNNGEAISDIEKIVIGKIPAMIVPTKYLDDLFIKEKLITLDDTLAYLEEIVQPTFRREEFPND